MIKSTSTYKLQYFERGFTLVELLISLVILSMILVLATSIAHQTSRTWEYTNSKIQEFSAARKAFETITNHLAQATLNIYWDYVDANGSGRTQANFVTFVPASYARQSELRFICGQTADLAPNANFPRPCHAIFFQAPLGYSESSSSLPTDILNNLVNSCGFYIEFNEDTALKPAFLQNQKSIKPRYRFRLMEFIEPANALTVYNYTSGKPNYSSNDWFGSAFKPLDSAPVHVLAENIIALILLPKYSKTQDSTGTVLAPFYAYDSADSSNLTTKNQLPPIVQMTMVAVDEPSAIKLAAINGNAMPSDLFANAPFREASKYATDLQTLENVLIQKKLNYRIFTTNVAIRAAKWGAN